MKIELPHGPPRIAALPPKQWPDEMRQAMAALQPPNPRHPYPENREGRPKALNALGTLAQYPALTRAFNTLNGHLLFATTLSERHRELLVLRVAAVRKSAYEWAQHVVLGEEVGLTSDEIRRIAEGPGAPGWSVLEGAMISAVDELISEAVISDGTWDRLAAELSDDQLMDLVFTVGAYDLLAMAFRSFRVALDKDLER